MHSNHAATTDRAPQPALSPTIPSGAHSRGLKHLVTRIAAQARQAREENRVQELARLGRLQQFD